MSKFVQKIALIVLVIFSFIWSANRNKYSENLIWSDLEGYYLYLPAVFIYGNFEGEGIRDTGYLKPYPGTDKIYSKYTYGVALMEAPFFLIVHSIAKFLDHPTDGKSRIYGFTMILAGLFYFWIGILFLYKYLRKYFKKIPVMVALVALALGTNLYYYSIFQPGMSHVFSFCLFAVFLYLTDKIIVREGKDIKRQLLHWAVYGFIFGMIVLIRPTNIIMGLFPLYIWFKEKKSHFQYIINHKGSLLLFTLLFILPFIPQMAYWKYVTDNWFMWSYGEESFSHWKEPKLIRVLFDAWNGWILYSPIVLIPLYSLFNGRNSNQFHERITIVILCLATYIFASWWAWWFGGAFGHRSYVEYLALLTLPFSVFLTNIESKRYLKYIIYVAIFFFCYYNIGLTHAYIPPWDGPNWTYESWWSMVKKIFFIQ